VSGCLGLFSRATLTREDIKHFIMVEFWNLNIPSFATNWNRNYAAFFLYLCNIRINNTFFLFKGTLIKPRYIVNIP
jgi:hypothetical protein